MEKASSRLKLLALLVAFMFAALSARLWYLQVLASEQAVRAENNNLVKIVQTDAPRGRILDAKGRTIVANRASTEVLVQQQKLGDDPEAVLLRLSNLLSIPVRVIVDELANKQYFEYEAIPIAVDVPDRYIAYIAEHQDPANNLFPGVSWTPASVRTYPYGSLAAHILGSVGRITPEQVKSGRFKSYGPNDEVGQSGLESGYERFLRGQDGYQKYLLNAAGKFIRQLGEQPATPGNDVRLYLNLHLQEIVERKLREGLLNARSVADTDGHLLKATSGAAVVLDPHTFGIEAMASYPTFEPKWFVGGLSGQHNDELNKPAAYAPLFNRATLAKIPPGSTFKPFIALSALGNGIAKLGAYYPCTGTYEFPGDTSHTVFSNWDTSINVSYNIQQALQHSCDTIFYRFGAAFYTVYRANPLGTGSEPLQRDLLRWFGFGRNTGIDLPSESAGLIPTAAWKERYAPEHPELFTPEEIHWLPGDDINMSIGQGFVAVTPLQLADAYAAIANGGRLCHPRLAASIQDEHGDMVHPIKNGSTCRNLPYSGEQLSYIRNALAAVVRPGGTAAVPFAGFPLSQVQVAGKTGTAQREPFQDTSWFAAMVGGTIDDPDHVIVVMVEEGGHGSTTAAPIVRSIIESMYHLNQGAQVGAGATD